MGRGASLSLLGLYTWNTGLFDDMSYPEDWSDTEKQCFIDNLLMEAAELEVLYPDWDFMKGAIKQWSAKEVLTWQRLFDAMMAEYDPIENYNRIEATTDQHSGTDSASHTGYDSVVGSGTDTDTHSKTSFDNNSLATTEQMSMQKGSTETHNYNSTLSNTHGEAITRRSNIHGNIGVKTTQSMLLEELDARPKLNILNIMVKSFINRFCIIVY